MFTLYIDVGRFRWCGAWPIGRSKSPDLIEQADESRLMGEQKMVAAFQSDETRARNALRDLATASLVKGCYELVPIPDPKLGPRKLDVATMYNIERYRPMYANKRGLPVFLQCAS